MAKVSIDLDKALTTLEHAARSASDAAFKPSADSEPVQQIVQGSHLTYRYILVTALLAKTLTSEVNPLALQAGAEGDGAYDARSLCHKVVVPNERKLFLGGLGGSNEPFLNKPARFPAISVTNAVRAGRDARTLKLLIKTLEATKTSKQAEALLKDAIYFARLSSQHSEKEVAEAIANVKGGRRQIYCLSTGTAYPFHSW